MRTKKTTRTLTVTLTALLAAATAAALPAGLAGAEPTSEVTLIPLSPPATTAPANPTSEVTLVPLPTATTEVSPTGGVEVSPGQPTDPTPVESTPAEPTPTVTTPTSPVDAVTIEVATINGSGCPVQSGTATVDPDSQSLTVAFSEYLASAGPEVTATAARRNCQLSLAVATPAGYSFTVGELGFTGHVALADGATALQQTSYYVQGSATTLTVAHSFEGPLDEDWTTTDDFGTGSNLLWSPCGVDRNLNINTELRVTAAGDAETVSTISMTELSGLVLAWRTC
jgi:hypothetical protein